MAPPAVTILDFKCSLNQQNISYAFYKMTWLVTNLQVPTVLLGTSVISVHHVRFCTDFREWFTSNPVCPRRSPRTVYSAFPKWEDQVHLRKTATSSALSMMEFQRLVHQFKPLEVLKTLNLLEAFQRKQDISYPVFDTCTHYLFLHVKSCYSYFYIHKIWDLWSLLLNTLLCWPWII